MSGKMSFGLSTMLFVIKTNAPNDEHFRYRQRRQELVYEDSRAIVLILGLCRSILPTYLDLVS